jgi:ankyrin repeat protein
MEPSNSSSSSSNQITNINTMPPLLHFLDTNADTNTILDAIKSGADVNAKNEEGYTPLFLAVGNGLMEVVTALIDNGADLNAKTTKSGNTALMIACRNGHIDIANLLINKGADVTIANNYGQTAYSTLISKIGLLPEPSEELKKRLQQNEFYALIRERTKFTTLKIRLATILGIHEGAGRRRHRYKSHKSRKTRRRKSRLSTRRKVKRHQ